MLAPLWEGALVTGRATWTVALTALALGGRAWADHPTAAFGTEASGPIGTIAATPLPARTFAAGLRTEVIENDAFSDRELAAFAARGLEDVHSIDRLLSTSLGLAYGLTDDLTVSARIPWLLRKNAREGHFHADIGEGEAESHGDVSGIGDAVFLANWRFYGSGALDVAVQLGFKAPTGETAEADAGERFDTELQPGTGSWDALAGAAVSRTAGRWSLHANVLYQATTEGMQDTEIGDALFYNAAVVYALSLARAHQHAHDAPAAHRHARWDLMLELNGERRWQNDAGGTADPNSGGDIVYLSPGVRLTWGGAGGFLSAGYPVIDDTDGVQTDVSFRLVAGIGFAFD